jgi:phytoene dehydrogenase-like protein
MPENAFDAVIVGSGPNGLAAGITLAREGLRVLILEARESPGGGMRTAELTLPGFYHDVCSAVHPMAGMSPFLSTLPLAKFGLEWVHPDVLLAHPLDGGRAAGLWRSVEETAAALPDGDGARWSRLMSPLLPSARGLFADLLGPLPLLPGHPLALVRFGLSAMRSAVGLAGAKFRSDEAQALFAGNAAHGFLPLDQLFTAAVGMALSLAGHAGGWPVARGGSGAITRALTRYFEALGGEIRCGEEVKDMRGLPAAAAVLFDTGPRAAARLAGDALPPGYRRRLERYRYGPGIFKLDYALSGPVPWTNPVCRQAGTVHVGGTMTEIAGAERAVWQGRGSDRPFVLVGQQSVCDATRAPAGQHTLWAYAHVPSGSPQDFSETITSQIERFAPGFRDVILATHAMNPRAVEAYNANNVGGDVIGGVMDLRQMFTRPVARWNPYTTPNPKLFHCSSATPPGAGVHGMCGYHAARTVLRKVFGMRMLPPEASGNQG